MKVHTIATIEIKKSFKGVLKVSAFMALFVIMIASIFDPDLFAGMEEMLEAYPEFILEMIGGALDLATFGGFYTVEFLSMIWIWLGIYFILQAGQDIPSTIESRIRAAPARIMLEQNVSLRPHCLSSGTLMMLGNKESK